MNTQQSVSQAEPDKHREPAATADFFDSELRTRIVVPADNLDTAIDGTQEQRAAAVLPAPDTAGDTAADPGDTKYDTANTTGSARLDRRDRKRSRTNGGARPQPRASSSGKLTALLSAASKQFGNLPDWSAVPILCILSIAAMLLLGQYFADGLSGKWKLAYMEPGGRKIISTVEMYAGPNGIYGTGNDPLSGIVEFRGTYDKTSRNMQFVRSSRNSLRPRMSFGGRLEPIEALPQRGNVGVFAYASGEWLTSKGAPPRSLVIKGYWKAVLVERDKPFSLPWLVSRVSAIVANSDVCMSFFCTMAGVVLLIGGTLVYTMFRYFGVDGEFARTSKKRYVPSQFKAEHKKTLQQFRAKQPGALPLGCRVEDRGLLSKNAELSLPAALREQNPHIVILGSGATGKTRLLARMISHDITSGDRAVVVLDSDGQLLKIVKKWLAKADPSGQLRKRIIEVDPVGDMNGPQFNPLHYPSDGQVFHAANAVVLAFKALYREAPGTQTKWDDQTADVLRNAVILLMLNRKSLADLPALLTDNDVRDSLLANIERQSGNRPECSTLLEAWGRYKKMARTEQWLNWVEPVLNRINPALSDARVRPVLTGTQNDIDLTEIIRSQRVLFVKLPVAHLHNSTTLIGSLILNGLRQAALRLSLADDEQERACSVYLDEFDSFLEAETFSAITNETRKLQLGLIAAGKSLQTLNEDFRNKIISGAGTLCCFALSRKDAELLGPQVFRVDGRKIKVQTITNFFNRVNSAPQFELISDEEKLNIDRLVGQQERTFFCYRVGTVAGVFQLETVDFPHA